MMRRLAAASAERGAADRAKSVRVSRSRVVFAAVSCASLVISLLYVFGFDGLQHFGRPPKLVSNRLSDPLLVNLSSVPEAAFAANAAAVRHDLPRQLAAAGRRHSDLPPSAPELVRYSSSVLTTVESDESCFTQGMEFLSDSRLVISCGLYKQSRVMTAEVTPSGELLVVNREWLPADIFAEGVTLLKKSNVLMLLTWRESRVLLLDPEGLTIVKQLNFGGEGWGISSLGTREDINNKIAARYGDDCFSDGGKSGANGGGQQNPCDGAVTVAPFSRGSEVVVITNGSHYLQHYELSLETGEMRLERVVPVLLNGNPVKYLNEVERVDHRTVLVNVWYDPNVLLVDIWTGAVRGVANLKSLVSGGRRPDVLNGLAMQPRDRRAYGRQRAQTGETAFFNSRLTVWVTGKLWGYLHRVLLTPLAAV